MGRAAGVPEVCWEHAWKRSSPLPPAHPSVKSPCGAGTQTLAACGSQEKAQCGRNTLL